MENPVDAWAGGQLRLFVRTEPHGELMATGVSTGEPVGDGFALMEGSGREVLPGVWIEIGMRDGRLQCIAIKSEGPPLTQGVLRRLGPIEKYVSDAAERLLVKLEADADGVYGVFGPLVATSEDREAAAETAANLSRRPGRPPAPDEEWRRVAEVWRDARRRGRSTTKAVGEAFGLSPDAAKKRIKRARARGFLPKEEEHGSSHPHGHPHEAQQELPRS